MTGEAAIEVARNSAITAEQNVIAAGLSQGDNVAVMPIDYGFQPTQGTLLIASLEELVVKRVDERVGEVAVHFPPLGFQVNKVI